MPLEKAILKSRDGAPDIRFMFNPQELAFEEAVETSESPGSRSETTGRPAVSFSNLPATKITISNIIFDTFETREDVLDRYIAPFKKAVKFIDGGAEQRPPTYTFLWRKKGPYLEYCFIEKLNYKLTKFLSDGTPVRAVIDSLVLKEIENPNRDSSSLPGAQVDRSDNTQSRQGAR